MRPAHWRQRRRRRPQPPRSSMLAKIAQTNINGERTIRRVDKLLLTSMQQRWRLELTSGVLTPPPTSSYSLQQSQQYSTREYVSSTT
jgi:hypothetical protein